MSTKSFEKNIEIRSKKLGKNFANALDIAKEKSESSIVSSTTRCKELKGEEIKNFFN